jgi:hypothetical protein
MKLYVIGDFVELPRPTIERLMDACDACMLAERAPFIGEIYTTTDGVSVIVTGVDHQGKVVTVEPTGGNPS